MILKKEKSGFDEIGNHLTKVLCYNYAERLFKSFGVQSWVGEIGSHIGLISRRPDQGLVGSRSLTEIPHPAHNIL